MESIPIEDSQDWWWYKAKSNTLNLILNSLKTNKRLRILEIGPGKGNNLNTLTKYGDVDILENDLGFIRFIKEKNPNVVSSYFTDFDEVTEIYDLIILLDEWGYPPIDRDEVYKEIFVFQALSFHQAKLFRPFCTAFLITKK